MKHLILLLLATMFSLFSYGQMSPITGNTHLCAGTSTSLSDALPGGTWTSGNTTIATVDINSGIVYGIAAGTTRIYYATSFGASDSTSTPFTVSSCIPCSGTPTPGTVTTSMLKACSSTSITLADTGASYGIHYQWQSSPDSLTWSNITGANAYVYTFTGLSATTYYRCMDTCIASGITSPTAGQKIIYLPCYHIIADSIKNPINTTTCNPPQFYVQVIDTSSLLLLKTYYGDGSHDSVTFTASSTTSSASPAHTYYSPGSYTIKQLVLFNNIPQDSIMFTYHYPSCKIFDLNFYFDLNGNHIRESNEPANGIPVNVRVDSAGIPIDTLTAVAGLYYKALGPVGTIYSFQLLPGTSYVSWPLSGICYDTVLSTINNYPPKYIALTCNSSSSFDLSVNAVIIGTGTHMQEGYVYVSNNYCTPTNATVTFHYSPKYDGPRSGYPSPSSSSPGTIIWDLPALSANTINPSVLQFSVNTLSVMLPLLDTVNESILVTPTSGDTNTSNNVFVHEDTVKGSYDPNFIEVSPRNCFMNDTQFQYIINFENTGNDTAYNIHVMDTLSDNLDVKSLSILTASAPMDIYVFKYGGHNVVKFDFPNINLLDSSHHGLCDGAVFFTIKNKPGMASGATISNEAGIYFDDNPVVMTNKVVNTKGCVTSVPVIASKQSIELYPNPTHDAITITAPDKITDVVITNIVGQVVYRESTTPYPLLKTGGDVLRVNVANLPAGTYIVKVNGSEVRKFVKE